MSTPLKGRTSAELRQWCMESRFVPVAQELLANLPEVASVVYAVGQFWADEAEDAVHEEIVLSVDADPAWPECIRPPLYVDGVLGDPYWRAQEDLDRRFPPLNDNREMITAFASHCAEGCDQGMEIGEAFTPYAIARRDGAGGVRLELVGRILRPDWEDRFQVGYDAEAEEQLPGPAAGSPARAESTAEASGGVPPRAGAGRGGILGLLRRLLGRRA